MITKSAYNFCIFEKLAGKSSEGFKRLRQALEDRSFNKDIVLGNLDRDMYDGIRRTYGRMPIYQGHQLPESAIGSDIVIPGLGESVDDGINHLYLHRMGRLNKHVVNPYTNKTVYAPDDVLYVMDGIFSPHAKRGLSYANDPAEKFGIQKFLSVGSDPNPVIVSPTDKNNILRYIVLRNRPYEKNIGVKTGYTLGRKDLHNRIGIAEGKRTAPINKQIPFDRYGLVSNPMLPGGFSPRSVQELRSQLTDASIRKALSEK